MDYALGFFALLLWPRACYGQPDVSALIPAARAREGGQNSFHETLCMRIVIVQS